MLPTVDPALEVGAYPADLAREVTCRDGSRVRLRPIRPDDAPRLQAMHARFSRETIYQRFFGATPQLTTPWARFLAEVDYRRRLALVLERGSDADPELIGVGRYEPTAEPDTAEVAFVVDDRWQGKGLGTILFTALLAAAHDRGIRRFRADVLAYNRRMLDLITRFARVDRRETRDAITSLVFSFRPGRPAPRAKGA
ncbi:MAG TPA: GNAT family protein [Pseudomonadales bacterium]|nr:GNAT family protein [Pseudomonadales bacterium]